MSEQKPEQKALPGLEGETSEAQEVKVGPLGKRIEVTVVPLFEIDMKNNGYIGLNDYSAQYKFNVKQKFPERVVELIEATTIPKRTYDETYTKEEGPSQAEVVTPMPRFNVIRH